MPVSLDTIHVREPAYRPERYRRAETSRIAEVRLPQLAAVVILSGPGHRPSDIPAASVILRALGPEAFAQLFVAVGDAVAVGAQRNSSGGRGCGAGQATKRWVAPPGAVCRLTPRLQVVRIR